jgi:hypothetical protein
MARELGLARDFFKKSAENKAIQRPSTLREVRVDATCDVSFHDGKWHWELYQPNGIKFAMSTVPYDSAEEAHWAMEEAAGLLSRASASFLAIQPRRAA